jgi:hypothetical protein
MYCVFLGRATATNAPSAGSVGTSQLASDAITAAKLNDDIISGQTALGATPADTDEFLVSDAGTIKRVDYSYLKGGANTPAFFARLTTVQSLSNNTLTKIEFDTEDFDTNTAYDNTTNYRFTVPSGEGGKYYFYASGYFVPSDESDLSYAQIYLYKNGSIYQGTNSDFRGGRIFTFTQHCAGIIDLSAGDYIEAYAYTSGTTAVNLEDDNGRVDRFNVFYGYKIIE